MENPVIPVRFQIELLISSKKVFTFFPSFPETIEIFRMTRIDFYCQAYHLSENFLWSLKSSTGCLIQIFRILERAHRSYTYVNGNLDSLN